MVQYLHLVYQSQRHSQLGAKQMLRLSFSSTTSPPPQGAWSRDKELHQADPVIKLKPAHWPIEMPCLSTMTSVVLKPRLRSSLVAALIELKRMEPLGWPGRVVEICFKRVLGNNTRISTLVMCSDCRPRHQGRLSERS
jgi:hypothetical protein